MIGVIAGIWSRATKTKGLTPRDERGAQNKQLNKGKREERFFLSSPPLVPSYTYIRTERALYRGDQLLNGSVNGSYIQ